ncbi:hypothetical protein KY329_03010 [Candidatus Woesearchaeota archaeon]|nr:hypothetical protein [Candidatus Woesearchaeota archaeon]
MAMAKGIGKIVAIFGAVLIIIIGIIIISKVAGGTPPVKSIILKTIDLRTSSADSVKKAQLVSALDTLVAQANDANIEEQWTRMTECLAAQCPDDAFFDMVFVATNEHQTDINNADLILNLLVVNRYWGSEEVVEFSKSLSEVDTQLQELNNRKAKSIWDDIVECNNACADKNGLYFELIRNIAEIS